jgi:hypothetical protein
LIDFTTTQCLLFPEIFAKPAVLQFDQRQGQAITATAHKLARIVFHLLSTKEAYSETVFHKSEEETIRRAQYRLRRQAARLGFQIIPAENG